MQDRTDIARKIRALRERTMANGCTEAEALAAAETALALAERYSLTFTDIEIGEERCQTTYLETGRKAMHEVQYALAAVAAATDTKCWFTWRNPDAPTGYHDRTRKVVFFGLPEDVAFAVYLTKTIKGTMDSELFAYRLRCRELGEQCGRRQGHSFLVGMASRISDRLFAMKAEQRAETARSTGRDLVVVKGAVVAQQFARLGIRLRSAGGGTGASDRGAESAGQAAGDRVGLNRPIGRGNGYMIGNG